MSWKAYRQHYRRSLLLAYPVMITQAGQMLVGIADNLMVGHVGAVPLAGAALANSVFTILMVFGLGMAMALTPLVGDAYGKGNLPLVGALYRHGIVTALGMGLLIFGITTLASPLLHHIGQPEHVVAEALPYFHVINFSLLPFLLFLNAKQFAEGVSSTRPAMFLTLACNVLNVALNYLLIYGKLGFPALGLMGAGYATLLSRVAMAACMMVWLRRSRSMAVFWKDIPAGWQRPLFASILRLGLPIGGQIVLEVASFSFGAMMMGTLGANPLAAHQIVLSMAGLTYMMANGLSTAATIRASNLLGSRNFEELRLAVWGTFHIVVAFMALSACAFIWGKHTLPALFIEEASVLEVAAPLMVIAAIFQLFDGIQVTALGALRGIQDVRVPTLFTLISYWGLALPSSYICAFVLGLGAEGIWYGYVVGLGAAAVLLTARIYRQLRRLPE